MAKHMNFGPTLGQYNFLSFKDKQIIVNNYEWSIDSGSENTKIIIVGTELITVFAYYRYTVSKILKIHSFTKYTALPV